MSPPSTDRRRHARARAYGRPLAAALLAAVAAGAGVPAARANMRAPRVEPQPPSSAARPLSGAGDSLSVLDETLVFRCAETACEVEARYRIQAREAVTAELAFVSPQPAPLTVRVGGATTAAVGVKVDIGSAAEPVAQDEIQAETSILENRHLAAVQVKFSAAFVAGENLVQVSYRQPLGRREYDHGYFSKGRLVDFFRYELWPLSDWKHAPGFHIDGQVVIHRPKPSWLRRIFSTPRSVGCRSSEHFLDSTLEQQGTDLRLGFHLGDPIPRRLWCEIGDQDLVSRP
jgi:hypothetical protein